MIKVYRYAIALSLLSYIPLSLAEVTTVESDSYETVRNIIKRKTLAIIQKMSYWSLISIIRF